MADPTYSIEYTMTRVPLGDPHGMRQTQGCEEFNYMDVICSSFTRPVRTDEALGDPVSAL